MIRFVVTTRIEAPLETVWGLSLDPAFHERTMHDYEGEQRGGPHRQLRLGEDTTWHAKHYGVGFTLTTRVVLLEPMTRFVDEQVRGPFAYFRHDRRFAVEGEGTLLTDDVEVGAPLGPLGLLAERVLLRRRMATLVLTRVEALVTEAEAAPRT